MAITTVVFDIGNVLIYWDRRNLYRKLIADEAEMERFLADVCTLGWHEPQDAGATCAEATTALTATFPQHRDLIAAFYERFDEMLAGEVPGMAQIVMALKARQIRVYGLSNWPAEMTRHALAHDILSHLDGVVFSGHEKVKKPNPALFHVLFERYGVRPDEALFIDDVADNVGAGITLGMHGHLFRTADHLMTTLQGYRLLGAKAP